MQKILVVILLSISAFACTPNNVKISATIGQQIDSAGMQGSFALMENSSEAFTVYNLSAYKDSGYAPLGTFFALPIYHCSRNRNHLKSLDSLILPKFYMVLK